MALRVGQAERRFNPLGLIVTVVVALVVFAVVGYFFSTSQYKSPNANGIVKATEVGTTTVGGVTVPHDTLAFETYPDSTGMVATGPYKGDPIHPSGNSGYPAYGPTNIFQVQAGALVTVTVRQYDSGGALNDSYFSHVIGTTNGRAVIDGKSVSSINTNNVGHTFTVRGVPGYAPGFFLNVPLPAEDGNNVGDSGPYHTVVFNFVAPKTPGTLAWNCEFPCGWSISGFGAVMGAYGFMSGFIHVV